MELTFVSTSVSYDEADGAQSVGVATVIPVHLLGGDTEVKLGRLLNVGI